MRKTLAYRLSFKWGVRTARWLGASKHSLRRRFFSLGSLHTSRSTAHTVAPPTSSHLRSSHRTAFESRSWTYLGHHQSRWCLALLIRGLACLVSSALQPEATHLRLRRGSNAPSRMELRQSTSVRPYSEGRSLHQSPPPDQHTHTYLSLC